ncbi:MAG: ThuA domain-containing protein [Verrucomicrobiaceae bacterium]|nr:ThuA domain-containing protein [Verrucomicrobiaceae bacterium]
MKHLTSLLFSLALGATACRAADHITYEPKDGPGKGRHVVFLTGDEEYRSEEGLPMLAKILSQRHGFKCTVLFSLDADGTINPNNGASLGHPEALDTADAIVMLIRFRHWSDEAMKHFHDAVQRGVPIVGLRTATHAFNMPKDSAYTAWTWNNKEGGFGRLVLGETWVSHWGRHRAEATRGVIEPSAKDNAILRGVADVFGTTDVYEAAPPADATILLRGQSLVGMNPTDAPADYKKKNHAGAEQGINDPMMPVAWTREVKNDSGRTNKILCTTMGAATDLASEGLRRLVVNGVYWGLGIEVPAKADVTYVDPYTPLMYGTKDGPDEGDPHRFRAFKKGVKPGDLALGK